MTSLTRSMTRVCILAFFLGCGSVDPPDEDVTPPSVPQGLTAQAISDTAVMVSWSPSTDDVGVTGYRVYRDGGLAHAMQATSIADTGLSPSTRYCYQVLAVDAAENQSRLCEMTCATTMGTSSHATLTVATAGNGTGTVTGAGISCGSDCTETVVSGTAITLTATSAGGSTFTGWTGCDAASGSSCTMSMTASKTVTATFNAAVNNYTLSVMKAGNGTGTVTGTGISCGSDCTETVVSGTAITLTATPAGGSTFAGWTGCDAASGSSCTMSMTANKTVTATFNATLCSANATRCVNGNIEVEERCNTAGTGWVPENCGPWRLCAAGTCRVACGMTSAPANPTVCLVPIADGVNNGEWTYWTDNRMASGTYMHARSQTSTGGYAPIYSETGETWPYIWSISSSGLVGVEFRLNQFGAYKHPMLGFRARRAGIITGYVNNFLTGVFAPTGPLGSCVQTATYSWNATACSVSTPMNQSLDYVGGWNSMLFTITGDGYGGAIDLLDVNYVYLTIAP